MSNKKYGMMELEQQIASAETDAISEEQNNADHNYSMLDSERRRIIESVPYPDIGKFDTAIDYDDRDRIQYKKSINQPFWDKQDEIEQYCQIGDLYSGHLRIDGRDFYITDKATLDTKLVQTGDHEFFLINADDRKYSRYIKWWRYPGENANVELSRNIVMQNRTVKDVDVILDKSSVVFSSITDAYLRKALIRNKNRAEAQSIIQTIQEKQDNIRSLPKTSSFIVQGCAGSGKTMVLLHRLRYLIYNREIDNDEYIFLIPSYSFKSFISDISRKFNISSNCILTYQEYYQNLLGKKSRESIEDASELIFSPEYLSDVYSRKFLSESYRELFEVFNEQANRLIGFCESQLDVLLEYEKLLIEDEIETQKKKTTVHIETVANEVLKYTGTQIKDQFDSIPAFIEEVTATYRQKKSEFELLSDPDFKVEIASDDERLINNSTLKKLHMFIGQEEDALSKANIFVARSHRNKLDLLKKQYESEKAKIVAELIEEEKRRIAEKTVHLGFVYDGITLSTVETVLDDINNEYSHAIAIIFSNQEKLDNLEEHLTKKYGTEIQALNDMIDQSSDFISASQNCIDNLAPCYNLFSEGIRFGIKLLSIFRAHISNQKEIEALQENLKLFSSRTDNQLQAYLYLLLFNSCKKRIKEKYDVKICDIYKHYWYLSLYCQYLTRSKWTGQKRYIFIDEAQDLSLSEIDLIYKINSSDDISPKFQTIMNLFGDTRQMITSHGIKSWDSVSQIIPTVHTLDENFRNTNQIVDYCNKNLSMKMVKVGVNMEPVSEYQSLRDAINKSVNRLIDAIFIVKDEYARSDLIELLNDSNLSNYQIYTVKEIKGLEFKEVFVFDTDMTENEKYIAYTRALVKLNVIKTLPKLADRKVDLRIQGQDDSNTSDN